MSWIYLALLAPFLYAIVNLLDDNLLHHVYESPSFAAVSAGLWGGIPLLSIFFVRVHGLPPEDVVSMIIAGLLTTGFYYFYFKALTTEFPAVVIAMFGLAPAFLPFIARFTVGEHLEAQEIVGFSIVLFGSLALAVTDAKKFKFSTALVPVLIAIVFMDAAALISKNVYEHANFLSAYVYLALGMALGGLGFLIIMFAENRQTFLRTKRTIVRLLPLFIAAELVGVAAEITLNLAIARGPVSLVKVIENIQPLFVLVIASALYPFWPKYFREAAGGNRLRKFFFIAIVIVGLIVIGLNSAK